MLNYFRSGRHAFLEQQFRSLHPLVTVKTFVNLLRQERIGKSQHAHPLVMGHIALDNGTGLIFRQTFRGKVQGLIEAETSQGTQFYHLTQIADPLLFGKRQAQNGRIRGHNQVLFQPALEPEAGYAECPVLVVHAVIKGVVAGFGYAERNPPLMSVFHLPFYHRSVGFIPEGILVGSHKEPGHQVLKHGP